MNTFPLEIITPEQAAEARMVVSVDAPGEQGRLTILAHHQPLVCRLSAGRLTVGGTEGAATHWQIGPGTLVVTPDRVTLLIRSISESPRH